MWPSPNSVLEPTHSLKITVFWHVFHSLWGPLVLLYNGYWALHFLQGKSAWYVALHSHLVPRLWMIELYPYFPIHLYGGAHNYWNPIITLPLPWCDLLWGTSCFDFQGVQSLPKIKYVWRACIEGDWLSFVLHILMNAYYLVTTECTWIKRTFDYPR
jgi:hypothetical protein